jgi:hypothetical protein
MTVSFLFLQARRPGWRSGDSRRDGSDRRSSLQRPREHGDEEEDQEDHEEDLRDRGRGTGDTGESQSRSDERDDQEGKSPAEHGISPFDVVVPESRISGATPHESSGSTIGCRIRGCGNYAEARGNLACRDPLIT